MISLQAGLLQSLDPVDRKRSWRAHCDNALARYDELDAAGQHWTPPPLLRNWQRIPVPAPVA